MTVTQSILASRACSKNIIGSQNHHLFARGLQKNMMLELLENFLLLYHIQEKG